MRSLLLAGAIFLALAFSSFAAGAPPPSACLKYEDVLAATPPGITVYEIPSDKLSAVLEDLNNAGIKLTGVTRGFLFPLNGTLFIGLEQDGCMLKPFPIGPDPATDPSAVSNGTPV